MKEDHFEQVAFVSFRNESGNLEEVQLDKMEFEGIEEDIQGRDLVSFCINGKVYKSYSFTKWILKK